MLHLLLGEWALNLAFLGLDLGSSTYSLCDLAWVTYPIRVLVNSTVKKKKKLKNLPHSVVRRIKRVRTCKMSITASVSQRLANIFITFSSTIASLLLQIPVARRRAGEGKKLCNLFSNQIIAVTGSNIPHTNFSPAPIPSPHYKQDSSATAVS